MEKPKGRGIGIIMDIFKKRGIESIEKMSEEEKATYDKWTFILSEGEISVEKILKFCESQIMLIENQWADTANSQEKNNRLISQHTVYRTLIKAISAPRGEAEALEKYLVSLLHTETPV